MDSQSSSGTPDDDSLMFLKHLAGKVERLSASLTEKEEEVMAERRTMSPKFNRQSFQKDVWDERVNPRAKSPTKSRGEIQRRQSWLELVKRAKKELTERELSTIPDLQTLQRIVRLYKLDDPINSARIELYWQELHGMRVPQKGKLCEPVISLHKIAPQPSMTPMTGISPRSGSIIYTNQQISPARSISPPLMRDGQNYISNPSQGSGADAEAFEGRDFHDLPKPVATYTRPVTVSVSHSPSPARADEVKLSDRVRPPSVSIDRRSVGTSKASPRSVLYSARSNTSSASPVQRVVSPPSKPVFTSGGSGKGTLRAIQLSPSKTSVARTRSAGSTVNTVNTCSGINRRYGNGPTSPNASDVRTIGTGRERDPNQREGGINRYYSNAPADPIPEVGRKKSPVRVLPQKNVSNPYSIGNDGESYKQIATIKSTNASNPYNIGEGSSLQSPGRRRVCGGNDPAAASNPNAVGDMEQSSPRGRAMSPLSHSNTTGKGSNPNPVVTEDVSPSRKRQTNTTESHGAGSNPNPHFDTITATSSKRSFSAPASQRQTWSISGSLKGTVAETCKKSTQSEAKIAQAIGSSNSSLTMVNAGREGESRRQAAVRKEKLDGDQYFHNMPQPTSRITDESFSVGPTRKSFSGIRISSTKNCSNLSESNFIPNPINRCQTPPGTRTGKSAHLIFGTDECPNKTIKRVCPLPYEKQHPSPNRRKQFLERTQEAQAHHIEFT
eukprot:TRINITY_DN20132_c0_g1_i1.p1 TRINITY_DN20132_c0_g1~~TRINITY_DN20132_c0_g1_i1.p1  ORF type:complete len:725 (+),score=126.56 TRINITY_DN20132_c0_g1_i1:56-2230(+)